MRILISILLLLTAQFSFGTADKNHKMIKNHSLGFPAVISARGQIEIKTEDGPPPNLKPGSQLRGKLKIITKKNSALKIQIDSARILFIEPETEIEIPGISWESGELTEVQLKHGTLRIYSEKTADFKIQISSPLFTQSWVPGYYIFEVSKNPVFAKVFVFQGQLEFSALNAEDRVLLKENQKVTFTGQSEDGEIAYDILLQGRKIPKGKLETVESLTGSEKNKWDMSEELKAEKKRQEALKKESQNKNRLKPGQICANPRGKFNECAWICKNNPKGEKKVCRLEQKSVTCERARCLAQGQWGDISTLPKEEAVLRCKAEPVIATCNY